MDRCFPIEQIEQMNKSTYLSLLSGFKRRPFSKIQYGIFVSLLSVHAKCMQYKEKKLNHRVPLSCSLYGSEDS